jgi:hypothetical protein
MEKDRYKQASDNNPAFDSIVTAFRYAYQLHSRRSENGLRYVQSWVAQKEMERDIFRYATEVCGMDNMKTQLAQHGAEYAEVEQEMIEYAEIQQEIIEQEK